MSKYSKSFVALDEAISLFIHEVDKQKLKNLAAGKWTVKDVLCHITFWHRYYAEQYAALAANRKPFIFTSRGGSVRNQEGVDSLKYKSKKELIDILNKSQASLHDSIVMKHVRKMDYTDKKQYRTEEFLDVVIGHIKRHALQVIRAKEIPDKVY